MGSWVIKKHFEWRIHALQQMMSRNISRGDVLNNRYSGEIIQLSLLTNPIPIYLIVGHSHGRPLQKF